MLEGAQASFLDVDHGTYPFVTSSNPTAGGACVGTGSRPRDIDRILGIAKAYVTRVGSGPFPTEVAGEQGTCSSSSGTSPGPTPGAAAGPGGWTWYCSRQAVRLNSLSEIAVTKLDVLSAFETVKVCTGYTDGDDLYEYVPYHQSVLHRVKPVYRDLPGWHEDLSEARTVSDLPRASTLTSKSSPSTRACP